MTQNLADALIRRLATDPAFRQTLAATPPELRRALLDAEGYRGVTPEWLSATAADSFKALTGGPDQVSTDQALDGITAATAAAAAVPAHAAFFLLASAPGQGGAPSGVPAPIPPGQAAFFLLASAPGAAAPPLVGGQPPGAPAHAAFFLLASAPATAAPAPASSTGPAPGEPAPGEPAPSEPTEPEKQ